MGKLFLTGIKKLLILLKKKVFRAFMYVFYPPRCVPRVLHYEGKDWVLVENKERMSSGRMGIYVSYVRFNKKETIWLTEVADENRMYVYRQMYRYLKECNAI